MRSSFILGVSQSEIENDFYMVDIPFLLEEKAKEKNMKLFEKVIIHLATNGRSMENDEFEKFMKNLSKPFETQKQNNEFDRDKFEQLRLLTNMGANRIR